ncbi:MAG: B12-binding domain-containing radical SAM protein [Thermodesulfobacteriota bacterium]
MPSLKILLIRHHQQPARADGSYRRHAFQLIPLGLAYLAATLRESGMTVTVCDSLVSIETKKQFLSMVQQSDPDLIGISAMTDGLPGAMEAAALIKKIRPTTPIVLGGAHMATFPEQTLQEGAFDLGIIGEGERTFAELATALAEKRQSLSELPGLAIKEKTGEIRCTRPRERISDLDQLAHPARDLFPNHRYRTLLGHNPVTYILTSRGCPYHCTFCDHSLWGNKVTFHSPRWILEEIQHCQAHGAREIYIYDETFTLQRERVLHLCELILQHRIRASFVISTRADHVDFEMLKLLKQAGCRQIRFGVETGSPVMLKKIRKGLSHTQIQRAFQDCRTLGIETFGYFMLGLPDETPEQMLETIRTAISLDPDWVNFNLLSVKPGTAIYRKLTRQSGRAPTNWLKGFLDGKSSEDDSYILPAGKNLADMNRMIHTAYRRFYFRPRFFLKRCRDLRHPALLYHYLTSIIGTYSHLFAGKFRNIHQ